LVFWYGFFEVVAVNDKYEIRSEHGTLLPYAPKSYDMACRVAHYLRSLAITEYRVNVVGGRCVSEVCYMDRTKDRYAMRVARRLLG
jgi:hypothetical protein